jgi:hypothetical protein
VHPDWDSNLRRTKALAPVRLCPAHRAPVLLRRPSLCAEGSLKSLKAAFVLSGKMHTDPSRPNPRF